MFIQQVNFRYPIVASEILAYQPAGLMRHFLYKNGNMFPELPAGAGNRNNWINGAK